MLKFWWCALKKQPATRKSDIFLLEKVHWSQTTFVCWFCWLQLSCNRAGTRAQPVLLLKLRTATVIHCWTSNFSREESTGSLQLDQCLLSWSETPCFKMGFTVFCSVHAAATENKKLIIDCWTRSVQNDSMQTQEDICCTRSHIQIVIFSKKRLRPCRDSLMLIESNTQRNEHPTTGIMNIVTRASGDELMNNSST